MNAYRRVHRLFDLISIGIAAAVAKLISDWITQISLGQEPKWVIVALTIIFVVLISELGSFLLKLIYVRLRFLRRLLLSGQFVEGVWIEFVTFDQEVKLTGLVQIDVDGYDLRLHGLSYNLDLDIEYHFWSRPDMLTVQWPVMRYAYEKRPLHGGTLQFQGVTHLTFNPSNGRPQSYTGAYMDLGSGQLTGLEGMLVTDEQELQLLKQHDKIPQILEKYLSKRISSK